MKNNKEISWTELKISYNPDEFSFKTTADLYPKEDIFKKDAASDALAFGLKLTSKGYNLFVSGEDETTLLDYTMSLAKEVAKKKRTPKDLGYIYNFSNPSMPLAVTLEIGEGEMLQDDLKEFIAFLQTELSKKLKADSVLKAQKKLENQMNEEKEQLLKNLKKSAKEAGLLVKFASNGVSFIALGKNNKPLTEDEYDKLDGKEKKRIKKSIEKLSELATECLDEITDIEEKYMEEATNLEEEIVLKEVNCFLKYLADKYGHYEWMRQFLQGISQDILDNLGLFHERSSEELKGLKEILPWVSQKTIDEVVEKYEFNLMTHHQQNEGAPVILAENATYTNLLGKIQVPSNYDMSKITHQQIQKGLFHDANGGYLIIHGSDLLEYPGSWEAIKKTLKSEKIAIENLPTANVINATGLEPQAVPAEVKVILIGQYEMYHLLAEYDEDFKKLFKFNIDFETQVISDKTYIEQLAYRLKYLMDKEKLPPLSIGSLLYLVQYGNRLAESQEKMITNLEPLMDLVREACLFSESEAIEREDIEKALHIREYLRKRIQKNMDEQYEKDIIMVDVTGFRVGQINGLAVYELDQFKFGRPSKITATTYKGQSGIVDIEKEAGLSGQIHAKGIQIITGFLGTQFAQERPLSLNCRICFEQSYGQIDGDSASSAELYAILSSLSGLPINQAIAVTGSMNQHGEIQPIGGVNEKIEGFFSVCKEKGLTGQQGVMIPKQNIGDLMLDDEVILAVKEGKFHIYSIGHVKEGVEILMDCVYEDLVEKVNEKIGRLTRTKKYRTLKNN